MDQEITVEGTLTQFMYRNPHSFVEDRGSGRQGWKMEIWSIEWGGGAQLTASHVTRDTLKPGDHVIVTGNPGRDPPSTAFACTKSCGRPTDGSGKA